MGYLPGPVPNAYLDGLNTLYEEWIGGFTLAPTLVVPSDRLDFVKDSKDLAAILSTIQERLRGRQGSLFPDAP